MNIWLMVMWINIFLFGIVSAKLQKNWILDNSCQQKGKSLSELRHLVPNEKVWQITHSCDKEEMDQYSLQPPQNLRWSMNPRGAKLLWDSISNRMKDKKLVLIGDSVMFQTLVGLVVYLSSIGIDCTPLGDPVSGYKCGSGMEIHRPFFSAKLNDEFLPLILPGILSADIAIVNAGLHYGMMKCDGPDNSGVCDDVRAFFKMISQNITNQQTKVKLAWMDSYRPHFPAPNGAYISWKNASSGSMNKYLSCARIPEPMSYDFVLYQPSHLVAREFPNIPIIKTYDMTYDRYDMHLGILTHHDPEKLDCVHLCYQVCFWEAIAFRMGKVINQLLDKDLGQLEKTGHSKFF
jgi:hypothetical protein